MENESEPIHSFFNLTYASYLVLPRSILQSAPVEWQKRFVKCIEELEELFGDVPNEGLYSIHLRNDKGQYIPDPLGDYERGRRRIPFNQSLPRKEG